MKVEFKTGKDEFGIVQTVGYDFVLDDGSVVFATHSDVDGINNYLAMYDAGTLPEGV